MAIDRAFVRRDLKRRADPDCAECGGDGIVTYTARNIDGETEVACSCVERDEPIEDDDAWSGGFAENH